MKLKFVHLGTIYQLNIIVFILIIHLPISSRYCRQIVDSQTVKDQLWLNIQKI